MRLSLPLPVQVEDVDVIASDKSLIYSLINRIKVWGAGERGERGHGKESQCQVLELMTCDAWYPPCMYRRTSATGASVRFWSWSRTTSPPRRTRCLTSSMPSRTG